MDELLTPTVADEGLHPVPAGVDGWCENYCFDGHDPASRVGFWVHLQRSALHPALMQEVTTIYLPDGRFGVWKGYSSQDGNSSGPIGPTLQFDVDGAPNRFRLHGVGVVQLCTGAELAAGPHHDRIDTLLELDLAFTPSSPVWNTRADPTTHKNSRSMHYEQLVDVNGLIRVGSSLFDLHCQGWRDHSTGQRDSARLASHYCAHAVFPSGRGFAIFKVVPLEGGIEMAAACLTTRSTLELARIVEVTSLASNSPEAGDAPYWLVLERKGEQFLIDATIENGFVSTSAPPSHMIVGVDSHSRGLIRWESQTTFSWDGETTLGHTERSIRL